MQDDIERKRKFPNRRAWGTHLGAVQSAATYPMVIEAVKPRREWFWQSAAQASTWLSGSERSTSY